MRGTLFAVVWAALASLLVPAAVAQHTGYNFKDLPKEIQNSRLFFAQHHGSEPRHTAPAGARKPSNLRGASGSGLHINPSAHQRW
jgi:hypothetical protein